MEVSVEISILETISDSKTSTKDKEGKKTKEKLRIIYKCNCDLRNQKKHKENCIYNLV